jgi:hypothetical protein
MGKDEIDFSSIKLNASSSEIQIFPVINPGFEILPSNVN